MRILFIHNRYQQAGGEDVVVRAETSLLRTRGHDVMVLEEDNDGIVGTLAAVKATLRAVYSWDSKRKVRTCIEQFRPDVAHVHNFFPRFSPSVYDACVDLCVPVVQTLHNYRLLCANAYLYRDGKVCGKCIGKSMGWAGVWNRCYRNSHVGSAAVTAMQVVHKVRGTWSQKVDKYVALTEFAREKFISAGLSREKIVRKPNFLHSDPGLGAGDGGYVLFVGRLSPEKGISTLLNAWRMLNLKRKLKIAGDGPMRSVVDEAARRDANIQCLGVCGSGEVHRLMKSAAAVVFPSEWYEGFPMVVVEALATGTPIIASKIGGLGEIVEHQRTGLFFTPGNPKDLSAAVEWIFGHPSELVEMRRQARAEYEAKYTAGHNYRMMMEIYEGVVGRAL
jgi:glycosyltransferase involved in cell wall biosynthesis